MYQFTFSNAFDKLQNQINAIARNGNRLHVVARCQSFWLAAMQKAEEGHGVAEYRLVDLPPADLATVEAAVNSAAEEGFRLLSIHPHSAGVSGGALFILEKVLEKSGA